MRGRNVAAALAVTALISLAFACSGPAARSGQVRVAEGATTGEIDTSSKAADRAPTLERTQAETVNVRTQYGGLDRQWARMLCIVLMLLFGSLSVAAGVDGPSNLSVKWGLVGLGVAAISAAVVLIGVFYA